MSDYRNDTGLPSVTEVISTWIDTRWFTEEHCERGRAVHEAVACHLQGLWVPPLPDEWTPYFDSARAWIDAQVDRVLMVEERLVHAAYRYTGQPDLVCTLRSANRQTVLIDWKTSQAAYKWWSLQDAAYRALAEQGSISAVQRGLTVRIKKDGSGCLITEHTRPKRDLSRFLALLSAHNIGKEIAG